jgi:hypothetical protein
MMTADRASDSIAWQGGGCAPRQTVKRITHRTLRIRPKKYLHPLFHVGPA